MAMTESKTLLEREAVMLRNENISIHRASRQPGASLSMADCERIAANTRRISEITEQIGDDWTEL